MIDLLFGVVKDSDYLLDLHSGELAQALEPYVGVPWIADGPLVEYVASSPAINAGRRPHGYAWHQMLVQLVEDLSYSSDG